MKELNFEKTMLSNGASLYVMAMPQAQSVAAGFLVMAGTRDELWPREAGISHALEHMLWVGGTKKFPTSKELTGYLEDIGGYAYPWTSKEATLHSFRAPAQHAERGFEVLQEVLFSPAFIQEKIPTEMQNIVQEIRMHHDIPESFLADESMGFLYGNHPLGRQIAGTEGSVSSFSREDFISYFSRMYIPSRLVFLSVGNLDLGHARDLFERYLVQGKIQEAYRGDPVSYGAVAKKSKIFHRELKQSHIALLAALGPAKGKSTRAVDLFSTMLSGGMSFPLFQEVREDLGLCYHIAADTELYSDVSSFYLYIGTDPVRIREAIDVTIGLIKKYKHDQKLLDRAKDLIKGRLSLRYENPLSTLEAAAFEVGAGEEPRGSSEILTELDEITIDDINDAVEQYLGTENIKEVVLGPTTE